MAMKRMAMKSGMKKSAMKSGMKRMKMAKKVSIKGKKWQVFAGSKQKTRGGLKKSDLKKNKYGKVVSAKASAQAKKGKSYKWVQSVQQARKALGVKGFCAIGGKSKQGQTLLAKARSFYKK